jgi:lysine/ornithine N-monooxygenase
VAGDPLSAEVRTEQSAALRSVRHDVAVEATGHMTADPSAFLVTLALDAREDGRRVHSRQWHLEFPRNGT